MNAKLKLLIASSYSISEADTAAEFSPNQFAMNQLADAGKAVLTSFPYIPGACAMMTGMWAAFIRDNTDYPIHAIAGSLYVDDFQVFGDELKTNSTESMFLQTNLDWDGHCWIVFGDYIGDVSIFRTAYSNASPPILKKKIKEQFNNGRGLFIAPLDSTIDIGLRYEPKYVLKDDEITGLFQGAMSLLRK